jgi:hypothetical protein
VLANIVGCEPEDVHIGMPVTLEFLDIDDERSAAQFRPAGASITASIEASIDASGSTG